MLARSALRLGEGPRGPGHVSAIRLEALFTTIMGTGYHASSSSLGLASLLLFLGLRTPFWPRVSISIMGGAPKGVDCASSIRLGPPGSWQPHLGLKVGAVCPPLIWKSP